MLLTAVKANFHSSTGDNLYEYTDLDKVFFHNVHFSDLGIQKLDDEKKRPILTINYNGKKIFRQYKQGSTLGVHRGEIAFLDKDSRYLGITGDNVKVEVKKSTFFEKIKYYINNPRQELRLSILFGLITTSIQMLYDIAKDLYGLIVSN